jgi:asparagine synthase (glutamine-hydrolysing)
MCGIFLYIQQLFHDAKTINEIYEKFNNLRHRGPEASLFNTFIRNNTEQINLGFHRLKITGTKNEVGMQPFYCPITNTYLLMNGEIYNYKELLLENNTNITLKSDCEIILYLYKNKYTINEIVKKIRGEYAFILMDLNKNKIFLARDELGIRPIFYNISENNISIGSEFKGLVINSNYRQVEPATIYTIDLDNYNIKVDKYLYYDIYSIIYFYKHEHLYKCLIKEKLTEAVKIRLDAERPIGFLLSGGFDSSLILAIAANIIFNDNLEHLMPINAFSIQYIDKNDSIEDNEDIKHAKSVVEYINNKYYRSLKKNIINHKIVYFNKEMGLKAIPEVIYYLESKCITTVRASTPMYILIKYIKENTDIKVLFSGECADELFFSYLYRCYAPTAIDFDNECRKLLKNIYLYDVLRADRIISSQGLEARVPFSDKEFITEYLSTDLKYRYEPDKIEKYLIREAFKENYLPEETRLRTKEAFSNSVNSVKADWIGDIINFCNSEKNMSEEEYYIYLMNKYKYPYNIINKNWLPNEKWVDTNGEPSATVLSVYKKNN